MLQTQSNRWRNLFDSSMASHKVTMLAYWKALVLMNKSVCCRVLLCVQFTVDPGVPAEQSGAHPNLRPGAGQSRSLPGTSHRHHPCSQPQPHGERPYEATGRGTEPL